MLLKIEHKVQRETVPVLVMFYRYLRSRANFLRVVSRLKQRLGEVYLVLTNQIFRCNGEHFTERSKKSDWLKNMV